MKIKMKKVCLLLIILVVVQSYSAFAAGNTTWAVPTRIDIERGNGFMVYGDFGNPGECSVSGRFYVNKDHPQYDKIYAAILAAYTAKKKIRAYIHLCEAIGWYSVSTTTYNILRPNGSFSIKD